MIKEENIKNIIYIAKSNKEDVAKIVHALRDWERYFCILPPPGLGWEDFQSIRQQIKGMAVLLIDLLWGTVRRKSRKDFLTIIG